MTRAFPIAGITAFALFLLASTNLVPVVIAVAAVAIVIAVLVFTLLLLEITIHIQWGKERRIRFERLPRKRRR